MTPDRWTDLEALFGERGACGGCWCMFWRLRRKEFDAGKGEANRAAFREVVERGPAPGVLAYSDGRAVGWCAVAPRSDYVVLANSRILQPVDDKPVWSISCLFVEKGHRRRGLSVKLIEETVRFAKKQGARIVEAYPVDPKAKQADAFVWTGIASAFAAAGFEEVARRSATRPVMRLVTVRGKRLVSIPGISSRREVVPDTLDPTRA